MKKAYLSTLGCKVNQFESAAFKTDMEIRGIGVTNDVSEADIVIINTCAVTNKASAQSRQEIRKAARRNPHASIVVTGCHAQIAADELAKLTDIDQHRLSIIGNDHKEHLVSSILDTDLRNQHLVSADIRVTDGIGSLSVKQFGGRSRAYLRIQDGCNNFCSYCIVPFTRGKSRSLPQDDVLRQAAAYAEAGHREIVVTGIHVGQYGDDLSNGCDITDLLERLCHSHPAVRFRLSSIEPLEINRKLLRLMQERHNFMPHLHIPLQSGDNHILGRMNRRYSREEFLDVIAHCKDVVPEAALGIDVLVGFPGETEQHFDNTRKLLQEINCTYLHVFPYSSRPGTRAADFNDHIDRTVKRKRVEILRQLDKKKKAAFYSRFLNSSRTALLERERDADGNLKGFTDNYVPVQVDGDDDLKNNVVTVELKELTGQLVKAQIVSIL